MKVFYTPEMVADANSFSKSPLKPKLFIEQALKKYGDRIEIVKPSPVTREQLYEAHSQEYVDGVLDLYTSNGFGNFSQEVADTLTWTSGSLLSAAYEALDSGIACSPTSGFHHASYDDGGGFCTFNGLMVTAIELLKKHNLRVSILDFDEHYGDGTADILKRLGYQNEIYHYSAGGDTGATCGGWKNYKDMQMPMLMDLAKDSDLVIYQAGADCHVDDPLGGWLTTKDMKERDEIIIGTLREAGVPVVWNLAGGYQADFKKVIDLHMTTLDVALQSVAVA